MKKIKAVLLCAVLMSVLLGNEQVAKAETGADEKLVVEEAIDFVDDEGNVMATFIPYSEDDPAPDKPGRTTTHSVNFTVFAYEKCCSSRVFVLKDGHRIDLNIVINPQVSSNIGLYNHVTGKYGWPAGGLSSSVWNGYIIVNGDGDYSLAFCNNTNITTTYKGTYTL